MSITGGEEEVAFADALVSEVLARQVTPLLNGQAGGRYMVHRWLEEHLSDPQLSSPEFVCWILGRSLDLVQQESRSASPDEHRAFLEVMIILNAVRQDFVLRHLRLDVNWRGVRIF